MLSEDLLPRCVLVFSTINLFIPYFTIHMVTLTSFAGGYKFSHINGPLFPACDFKALLVPIGMLIL